MSSFFTRLIPVLVLLAAPSLNAQTIIAHYTFDGTGFPITDSAGTNNITISANEGCGSLSSTTDAKAGAHAESFNSNVGGTCPNWLKPPTNQILPTISGSFSISLWLKTTETPGNDTDNGFLGEGIVSAFNSGGGSGGSLVPMTLTGHKLAFFTGGAPRTTPCTRSLPLTRVLMCTWW